MSARAVGLQGDLLRGADSVNLTGVPACLGTAGTSESLRLTPLYTRKSLQMAADRRSRMTVPPSSLGVPDGLVTDRTLLRLNSSEVFYHITTDDTRNNRKGELLTFSSVASGVGGGMHAFIHGKGPLFGYARANTSATAIQPSTNIKVQAVLSFSAVIDICHPCTREFRYETERGEAK